MTFEQLATAWIKSKVRISDTTLSDYQSTLDCFLLPYFGPRKVESLSRLDLETYRAEMSEGLPEACRLAREAKLAVMQADNSKAHLKPLKKPGARTINKCLGVLISILGYGKKIRVVSENVAEDIDKIPDAQGEERSIEKNVLTPVELRRTIEHAVDPYRIPIAIAIYDGLREEEILGLKWSDFASDYCTAEVKRTYRRGRFGKTKTAASRRTIEIPAELRTMLKEWRLRCPANKHDLVCPSITGRPMQASTLLQVGFLPALVRAGVRRVRFHDLRHSFASNLLGAGVDIVTVSKAMGHANVQITLTVYAHAVPKPRQGACDKMAALLNQTGNKLETSAPEAVGAVLSEAA